MQQPSSRQRVSLACTTCRARRTRCDGQLPECGTCLRTGRQCEYVHDAERRKPPSKRYIEALHSRIESLERQLQQCHQETVDGVKSSARASRNPINPSAGASQNPVNPPRDPVDDLTDIYGRLDVAEDGHLRYFGASSYFNMLRRPPYDGDTTARGHLPMLSPSPALSSFPAPTQVDIPREVQDHLLDLYWTWQNPWQYLVHKDAFCRALEQGRHDEYCTPLLLHSVLALAARYSDDISLRTDPADANTAGDRLQWTAKSILQSEVEHPTVSTVVSVAILALREMSTNREAIGWTYIGIAVRIAYNLGLHLDCTPWRNQNQISEEQAEIRRIAWWGCYLLDKLFNIGLGRPSMIKEWDITALKPSLLRTVEYCPWQVPGNGVNIAIPVSRSISNMHYMCEIFQIVSNALDQIYAPNSRLSLVEKEDLASKTYLELETLYKNLPSFLKLPRSAQNPRPAHTYSLHLQYHTVTILLHRPFLRRRQELSPLSELLASTDLTHNQICTASAEAISSIMKAYRTHYTLRRIPISTVHAVGTGSVVHLLDATSRDPLRSPTAIRLLKFNMTCLKEMSTAWTWGLRAIRSLQILAEGWAVNEKLFLHAPRDDPKHSSQTQDSIQQSNEVAPGWWEGSPANNINWLLDFDSGLDHEPADMFDFNNGVWAIFS
ncbi:hypothetical protein ASPZODRAFT_105265 [Penicilliopsis zonata CBS 506.65]|uniref:Zn(2)-C6 fungal-type domain-containing protein n=1 Tax=Penicilliopsis zonata CBS 506.65 TaxID=1073090 RepID=A0A1L9S5D0_9EURO|nr:hypothetical protein ASPZODRAFT_105265 [Penicilliopsis zonata CBS 506.65]OJJ42372.1 hypothetical protein ASPZODRAFT_105265 [Penicilliopsis zonata CBS 506.65]